MYLTVDQKCLPSTVYNYVKTNNQVMIVCVRVIMQITLYYHISHLMFEY